MSAIDGSRDPADDDPLRTLVPEGEYRVIYESFVKKFLFSRWNYLVTFRISEPGPHFGKPILRYYAIPSGRTPARSSSLSKDYRGATGKLPPARGSLDPRRFLANREVLARVVTVKTEMDGGKRIPIAEAFWYSRIDRILAATTGPAATPEVMSLSGS